jgi:hypothetical protein
MIFNVSGNLHRRRTNTNNGHVTHIEDALFCNLEEDDSVRNKEKVVDDQRKKDDQTIRLVLIDKKLHGQHDQPCKTYRFGEPTNLVQRPQSWFGVNAENGKQDRPGWENDCKKPQVDLNGHDGMPFQFKQRSKAVRHKETGCRQQQVKQPDVKGENSFALVNHGFLTSQKQK